MMQEKDIELTIDDINLEVLIEDRSEEADVLHEMVVALDFAILDYQYDARRAETISDVQYLNRTREYLRDTLARMIREIDFHTDAGVDTVIDSYSDEQSF